MILLVPIESGGGRHMLRVDVWVLVVTGHFGIPVAQTERVVAEHNSQRYHEKNGLYEKPRKQL